MNKIHVLAATLLALPSLAGAQTAPAINAILSFSTTSVGNDNGTARQNAFNLVSDVVFSDMVSLGFDAEYARISNDAFDITMDVNRLQLEPTLHLSNGIYVGAYMQNWTASVMGSSISADGSGAFAGYDAGMWTVEGYFGTTSSAAIFGLENLMNVQNLGATVTVRPMENLELFAHVARIRVDNEEFGLIGDLNLRAFGGQYDLNNGFMVYAANQSLQLGIETTALNQTAIGVGFDLSRLNSSIPGTVTLELARNSVEGGLIDDNVATIGWVMPIGKAKTTPLSSIARTARGGIRGAVVAGAGSLTLLSALGSPG